MDTNFKDTPIQNKWKTVQNNSIKTESSDINYDNNWPTIGESIKVKTTYIPPYLRNVVQSHTEFLQTE